MKKIEWKNFHKFEAKNDQSSYTVILLQEYYKLLNKHIPKGISSLEIGCGSGFWMIYFNKHFHHKVHGLDSSGYAINTSRKNFIDAGIEYKLYHQNLFEHKAKYDFVYLFGVIEHFEDPISVLKACNKLVKKGGYLLIEVPNFSLINRFLTRYLGCSNNSKKFSEYMNIHNLSITNKKGFFKLTENLRNYTPIYKDYAGIFDIGLLKLEFLEGIGSNKYGCAERLIFKFKSLFKIINLCSLNSISPGIIYIGKKMHN